MYQRESFCIYRPLSTNMFNLRDCQYIRNKRKCIFLFMNKFLFIFFSLVDSIFFLLFLHTFLIQFKLSLCECGLANVSKAVTYFELLHMFVFPRAVLLPSSHPFYQALYQQAHRDKHLNSGTILRDYILCMYRCFLYYSI